MIKNIWSKLRLDHLYYFIAALVGARLFTRCLQGWGKVHLPNFGFQNLWMGLLITVAFHLFILALAWIYSKWIIRLSPLILYPGFLLGFYFISLLNSLTLFLPEPLLLRLILAGLIAGPILKACRSKNNIRPLFSRPSARQWMGIALIGLWLIHSGLFFLEINLQPDRKPFVDESTFWYPAAEEIILTGGLPSRAGNLSATSAHPYGIPFIAALPAMTAGFRHPSAAYFMPFAVILTLTVFLASIRDNKWALLFFLTALFVTFNSRGWPGELLYARIYGEGLSTVFFLAVCFELRRLTDETRIPAIEFYTLCFVFGLLALTKFPLAAVWPIFLLPLMILYGRQRSPRQSLMAAVSGLLLSFIPLLTWLIFKARHQITNRPHQPDWAALAQRLATPNLDMLTRVYQHLINQAPDGTAFALIATAFFIAEKPKKYTSIFSTILLFGGLIIFYYGYIYHYGRLGGDHASSLRYLMPMTLALFYFGALGYENVMQRIAAASWPKILTWGASLILLGLFIPKLF